ncbi:TraR/DksA C4-type zinc finger protein [Catellatospora sp. NPDC049609]|uniref:TraR/DksA family transcriptional regulator n=1 Tax=Catellatospora sp. NPDC049609 TaxID=3155505 RepID=UPI00341F088B
MSSTSTRETLRRARADTERQIAALTGDLAAVIDASRASNADDEHDPEGATIGFERAQVSALLDSARRRLADLDDALRRCEEGTYGACERCGRPIPAERLDLLPSTRTCVACAARRRPPA